MATPAAASTSRSCLLHVHCKVSTEPLAMVNTDGIILPYQIIPDLVLLSMRNLEFHWLQGRHWRHHSRIHEVAKLPSAEVLDMALSKMEPRKKQGYMDQLKKSTTCSAPVPALPAPAEIRMEAAKVEQDILSKLEVAQRY